MPTSDLRPAGNDRIADIYARKGLDPEGNPVPKQPKAAKSTGPPQWNPTGYWPDPYAERFRKEFRPHEFIGALNQSQEAQDYAHPEELAETVGAQSVREGEKATTEETTQEAANQGLGRGFAEQSRSNIREQGNQQISDNILGAHLEGQSRRYQQAAMLAASLMEANKSRFTAYLNAQAQKSAASSDLLGLFGDVIGGAISGFAVGGPVGAVAGAGVGAAKGISDQNDEQEGGA